MATRATEEFFARRVRLPAAAAGPIARPEHPSHHCVEAVLVLAVEDARRPETIHV